jgi:hypothetical protein
MVLALGGSQMPTWRFRAFLVVVWFFKLKSSINSKVVAAIAIGFPNFPKGDMLKICL